MRVDCPICETPFERSANVRWTKDAFDVVRCPSCTLLFRADLPTAVADLDEIYSLGYFKAGTDRGGQGYFDYVADEELHRLAARRRLDLLDPPRGQLLDVGAAAGFFVDEARQRGWDARGIDVAAPMLDWGRHELQAPLERATLADVTAEPRSLDVMTMWDYLEHSLDPVADLTRAHDLLRPGGTLALSTGDASAVVARLSGVRWHLLTPHHHNFYFTPRTLGRLLHRTGFELERLSHPGSRYPLRYLVHKARTLVGVRALDRLTARLAQTGAGTIAVPLNLWDIMTVVARRT
jgi:2-polyprenyl-3-methyl-5-hydroxy-6-metoxy-1,4-benzoquinol methylase